MAGIRRHACLLLLALPLPACSKVVLPKENDRTQYRLQPEIFGTQWPLPPKLDGSAVKGTSPDELLDIVVHNSEIAKAYPLVRNIVFPLEWENTFDGLYVLTACRNYWWVSYVVSTVYLLGLWAGTAVMKNKQAWGLKPLLAFWNLFLAVFSLIGVVRTAPHLFGMLYEYGFEYSICRSAINGYGSGPVGLWVAFFVFSKYLELFDTVLLVVRKKKVGFLHWYHHCSVLLYVWHAFVWEMPTGIYFMVMNYSVHSIMYFYYFLAAVTKPPKWALFVTILQLSQMAWGIFITVSHTYTLLNNTVPNCDGHLPNLTAALGMYASYFLLFAQFLAQRYCRKSSTNGSNGDKKKLS